MSPVTSTGTGRGERLTLHVARPGLPAVAVAPHPTVMPGDGPHKNLGAIFGSHAELTTPQAEDARVTRPKHLNDRPRPEPHLLQPMNNVRRSINPHNLGRLADF